MDKRRRPLTPCEHLLARQQMIAMARRHPEWGVPGILREIRKSLHLTLADMARIGRISELTLRNAEKGRSSPSSLSTVDGLLRPLGLKLAIVRVAQRDDPASAAARMKVRERTGKPDGIRGASLRQAERGRRVACAPAVQP